MPIDSVARLAEKASYPHVTIALSELCGATSSLNRRNDKKKTNGGVNSDVIELNQRCEMLMSEYHQSIEDGIITVN